MKIDFVHFEFILYFQTALSALVACFVFVRFKVRPLYVKLIGLSFLLGFLTHIIGFQIEGRFRNPLQAVYEVLHFMVIVYIYDLVLNKRYSKYLTVSTVFFLGFAIYNFLFFQQSEMNSYSIVLASFLIISYIILYFYRLMVDLPSLHLHRLPMFWFNSAFLIYRAGTLLLYIFRPYLIHVLNDDLLVYWSFHNSLSILEHFIILIGLYYDLQLASTQSRVVNP